MYLRFGKRFFDFFVASAGLAFLLIPLGIIAFIIWLTSGFPILFTQERIGKNGKVFLIKKFRTMSTDKFDLNTITVFDDPRITPIGRHLRRWKLDELPQLWNVLMGDMSLVGPRPDVPGYADKITGEERKILNLRPGITGPATLAFRDEETILQRQSDPKKFNDEVIFPEKIRINLKYLKECSFLKDLQYIKKTIIF